MELNYENVKRIGKLSRIRLNDQEIDQYKTELTGIFNWIEKLTLLDVSGVTLQDLVPDETMTERPDEVTDGDKVDEILVNAPEKNHNMFSVPKMVE